MKKCAWLIIAFLCSADSPVICQTIQGDFFGGRLLIRAGRSVIEFPINVKGLIFDTTPHDSTTCEPETWRKLGALTVDSLILKTSTVPLVDSAQIENISIKSLALTEGLRSIGTQSLVRIYSGRAPGDTLFWDSVRLRWHRIPDLSASYEIWFSDSLNLDSVFLRIKDVSDSIGVGRIPVPVEDGSFGEG